jgi:23S rRNA pseudouridine2605 synthase
MTPGTDTVRVQKALADAGVASRRAAERMVEEGRVSVNGRPARIGDRVDPRADRIAVDGRAIGDRQGPVYLAMHKPYGVTSTVRDRHAERTVVDLLPVAHRGTRLYPVGRLDRDSEGLLLLTNDGEWAQRLLHPSHEVDREYAVGIERPLDPAARRDLEHGVRLEEGVARFDALREQTAAETRALEGLAGPSGDRLRWYRVVVRQGWKRQVRRMFATVGVPVRRLVRVRVGSLRLRDLGPGEVRPLSGAERARLAGDAARGERRDPRSGLVVSLDGPASSGKSSVGAGAALELGYRFCDTGVLYRALTWLALREGVDAEAADTLVALVGELELVADEQARLRRVRVGGEDVTEGIHTPDVDRTVSLVSRHHAVRGALLPVQRALAAEGRIIMAGRDIGTVVLPDADLKLFIDVTIEERARRRVAERGLEPGSGEAAEVEADLRRRDGIDQTREVAPLRIPDDALLIRSDGNTLAETIAEVVALVRAAERRPA